MKITNRKGFGMVGAVMIITILVIMSLGFFQLTNYGTTSTRRDINELRLQWAAESAANYNVNWWANQTEEVRNDWPSTYMSPEGEGPFSDTANPLLHESDFPGADSITTNGDLYLHSSWKYEGHPSNNADLMAMEGYEIYLTRYKGERKDRDSCAVWVLESTAYDPVTDNAVKITMSNIYNIEIHVELFWLQQAEAIVTTMMGLGDGGNRGFFGDNDYRWGNCYFSDMIQLTFGGMGQEDGPKFFGSVKSSSAAITQWGSNTNSVTDIVTNTTSDFYHGLTGITSDFASATEDEALTVIGKSFKAGYVQGAPAIDPEDFMWTWEDIEEYSGQSGGLGIYNIDEDESLNLIKDGRTTVDVVLKTVDIGSGLFKTIAEISQNGALKKTVPIGESTGSWAMIAVPDGYGHVSIEGVSNDNFALATESSTVDIVGSLWLQGMTEEKKILEGRASELDGLETDAMGVVMNGLYDAMATIDPKGHLGLLSCLANKEGDIVNEVTFNIIPEELLFMNTALISWNGAIEALKATSEGTDLRFFNIGSAITLGNQSAVDPAGSSKWDYLLIQDARYDDPDEDTFLGIGSSPSQFEHETLQGLNPKYKWTKTQYGGIDGESDVLSILPGT